ncbi:MAG: VOC family protein, partial [Acidobacteria bacterium]|nr:VOC family protein [Acidobacteriota bacterium]
NLPTYARFECPDGDATFSVEKKTNCADGGIVVYFECDDLEATITALKTSGLEIDSEPNDQPWLWREAYLTDPDGNKLCLFCAGTNRKNPPWRLRT